MRCRFLLQLLFALPVVLHAQIPTWPPGGITRGPGGNIFPSNRYVPSTKRWNLVWADQIIPGSVTPGKIEFAAKNYIGTQKIFADQVALFRNHNPNFLMLIYHLAAGLNPERNDDCPDPKSNRGEEFIGVVTPRGYVAEIPAYLRPWLATAGSERYEKMFQHYDTPIDSSRRVWHQDPYWLMDIANPDWTDYIAATTNDWIEGTAADGCFFDVAVETNVSLYNPKQGNPPPRDFDWWRAPHGPSDAVGAMTDRSQFDEWMNARFRSYFRWIYYSYHRAVADYLLIPNVDQMVTTVYDPVWMDDTDERSTIDGAMIENFGGYRGNDMWLTLERGVRHITGRGKILIAQFGAADARERLRRTAMYMLIKNEQSFINIINSGKVEWYPEYEIDLGDQSPVPADLEELRVSGSGDAGLWKRDYANGVVLCNTSKEDVSYDPPGEGWSRLATSGGGDVGEEGMPVSQSISMISFAGPVTVAAGNAVVLHRQGGASSAPERQADEGIDEGIEAAWIDGALEIGFDAPLAGRYEISIVDISGNVVLSETGLLDARRRLRTEGVRLSSGVYLFRLATGGRVRTGSFVVVR